MIQEITISGNSEIPIRPLIESAVQSELRTLDMAIHRTNQRLISFQEKYNMGSDEFENRFETGDISESLDFIEWLGEIKTLALLNAHKQTLRGVNFADKRVFPGDC